MLIYIVEDDTDIRELESYAMKSSGYEVQSFGESKSFFKACTAEIPQLVILDVMLPDFDGLPVLEKMRRDAVTKNVPVILVTAKGSEMDKVKGLDMGADDYITKPFNILEVKARMKAILRRNAVTEKKAVKSNIINAGDMKIDCDSRNLYIAGRPINLTAKEFDLLELLAVNPGKVYSRDNLLKAVWGQDYSGDGRTVDVHMRRLREKIEDNPSEPKYVHTKWGVGYYFNV